MKWPLLDVPASATVKDARSPSPAHLVSLFLLKAQKGHCHWACPISLPPPSPRSSSAASSVWARRSGVLLLHVPTATTSAHTHTTQDVMWSEMPALPLAGDPGPPPPPLHRGSPVLSLPLELSSQPSLPLRSCIATVEEAVLYQML